MVLGRSNKIFIKHCNKIFCYSNKIKNFPNKFTAEYIFLMNQNDSSIPILNSASKNRLEELNHEWMELKNRSEELIQKVIPTYNKLLWKNEIGALNVK